MSARTTIRPACIALVGLLAPGAARAEPTRAPVEGDVTLEYVRAPQASACPDEAALRERAGDAFDFHDPFVAPGQRASSHLRVEIERAGSSYRGKMLFVDDDGRELATSIEEHANCDALVWVLGHRVGLAVLHKPAPNPVVTPAPAPVVVTPPPVVVCDAKCAERLAGRVEEPKEPSLTIVAGASMTAGWSADVGPGAWAGIAVGFGWLSLGAEARGTFPARALRLDPVRSASIATVALAVVPCARWRVVSGCAVAEVGSYTLLVPSSSTPTVDDVLVTLGARVGVDIPLGAGLSVRGFAELGLHPYLPIFTVRLMNAASSPVERWVTPVASGLFGVGLGWTL